MSYRDPIYSTCHKVEEDDLGEAADWLIAINSGKVRFSQLREPKTNEVKIRAEELIRHCVIFHQIGTIDEPVDFGWLFFSEAMSHETPSRGKLCTCWMIHGLFTGSFQFQRRMWRSWPTTARRRFRRSLGP